MFKSYLAKRQETLRLRWNPVKPSPKRLLGTTPLSTSKSPPTTHQDSPVLRTTLRLEIHQDGRRKHGLLAHQPQRFHVTIRDNGRTLQATTRQVSRNTQLLQRQIHRRLLETSIKPGRHSRHAKTGNRKRTLRNTHRSQRQHFRPLPRKNVTKTLLQTPLEDVRIIL